MSRETENEALDKIQDIADILSKHDVPTDVQEGLRIIQSAGELSGHLECKSE